VSAAISSIAAGVTAAPNFGGSDAPGRALQSLSSLSAYVPASAQPALASLLSRVSAAGAQATADPAIQAAISSIYAQASPALSSAASYKSSTSAAGLVASLLSSGAVPVRTAVISDGRAISSALAAAGATGTVNPALSTAVSNLLVGATGVAGGIIVAQQSALSAAMASMTASPAQASARAQSALQGVGSSVWAPILSGASSVGAQASSLGALRVASAISSLAGNINSAVKFNLPAQSSVAAVMASYVNPALPTSTPFIIGGPSGFQTSYRPTATFGGSVSASGTAAPIGGTSILPTCTEGSTIPDTVNVIEFCGSIMTCNEGVVSKNAAATIDTLVVNGVTNISFCGSTLRCGANGLGQAKYTLSVVAPANVDVDLQEEIVVWAWYMIMYFFCWCSMDFLC
jgi:hypothetical protein